MSPQQQSALQRLRGRATQPAGAQRGSGQAGSPLERLRARGTTEPAGPAEEPVGFFGGIAEELPSLGDLGRLAMGLTSFTRNITNPATQGVAAAQAAPVVAGIGAQQTEQMDLAAEKFLDARERPGLNLRELSEGVGRFVAGSLPIIGPMAATVGERFGAGEIARGAGNVVGIFGPELATAGAGKLTRAARATGAVPLTRAQRGGAGAGLAEFGEGFVSRTIPGVRRFREFRQAQQAALIDNVAESVVQDISTFRGTAQELGERIQTRLDDSLDRLKREAGQMYDEIDRTANPEVVAFDIAIEGAEQGVKRTSEVQRSVSTAGLKTFAREQLKRLKDQSELIDPQLLAQSEGILQTIVNSPARTSFRIAQDARSDLLKIARRHGDPLPGKAGGIARKLSALTDEAMVEGAQRVGGNDLVKLVREANDRWRFAAETFNDSFVRKFIDANPENAHQLLAKMPLEEVDTLRDLVGRDVFNDMKSRVVRDIIEESTQGELSALAKQSGPATFGIGEEALTREFPRVLRGSSLESKLERFGIERLETIFGQKHTRDLIGLASFAQKVGLEGTQNLAPALLAGMANANIIQGTLRAVSGDFGALFTGIGGTVFTSPAAMVIGTNMLSRLMTKPEGVRSLRGFLRAVGSKQGRPATFWSRQMAKALGDDFDPEEVGEQLREAERQQQEQPASAPEPEPEVEEPVADTRSDVQKAADALAARVSREGGIAAVPPGILSATGDVSLEREIRPLLRSMSMLEVSRFIAENPGLKKFVREIRTA